MLLIASFSTAVANAALAALYIYFDEAKGQLTTNIVLNVVLDCRRLHGSARLKVPVSLAIVVQCTRSRISEEASRTFEVY